MSPPGTREARTAAVLGNPGDHSTALPAGERTTALANQRSRTGGVVVAPAASYPASGRRRYALLLVLSCPFCRYAHAHRGAEYGGLRRAGCGRGEYLVKPTTAARVPA